MLAFGVGAGGVAPALFERMRDVWMCGRILHIDVFSTVKLISAVLR